MPEIASIRVLHRLQLLRSPFEKHFAITQHRKRVLDSPPSDSRPRGFVTVRQHAIRRNIEMKICQRESVLQPVRCQQRRHSVNITQPQDQRDDCL